MGGAHGGRADGRTVRLTYDGGRTKFQLESSIGSFFHLPLIIIATIRNQPCDSTAWLSALPPFLAFARFLVSSIVSCRRWCLFLSYSILSLGGTVVGHGWELLRWILFRFVIYLSLTTTTK